MAQTQWFLLPALTVISHLVLAVAAAASTENMVALSPLAALRPPDCPDKCGEVDIPYPFGIGEQCSWQGMYNLICNHNFTPPRPYQGDVEVVDISVVSGEIRVRVDVSSLCESSNKIVSKSTTLNLGLQFLISATRNEFTAIGCNTLAQLQGPSYYSGCITSCVSLEAAARDGDRCTGLGCCQTSIPENLSHIVNNWAPVNTTGNQVWRFSPCSYAFVAEKGWYHFEREDLQNSIFFRKLGDRNVTEVPIVLDWAIRRNGSCPPPAEKDGVMGEPTASACVSANSHCVNTTQGIGYLCNCSKGYTGNPYVSGGCTNINECKPPESNSCPSGSKCIDTEGSYKCPCKFGRRGNDCRPIFPAPAAAVLATFIASLLLALLLLSVHQDQKRRKKAANYDKNGGKILNSAAGIIIFTEKKLVKMTNHYDTLIGEGAFGKVFKGTTDNKEVVAVKRSKKEDKDLGKRANKNVQQGDDIVNEITFQFRNSHTNLVRLVGCCLETNIPVLVFEFISKGSLHKLLHDETHKVLRLQTRLDIAIGSAEALAYIHSSHGDHNHIHGDIKSANILLDDNLVPKVSDFGSSKILSVDMYALAVAADMSYIDPVYMKTERFVAKSDVYSFSVVLLELITRKTVKYGENKSKSLPIDFIKSCKEMGNGREMYDKVILSHGDGVQCQYCIECLDKIGDLAVRCLKEDVDERPTMAEVVDELKQVAKELADKCKQQ
ncbi:wall-associated receptor kinase 2-like [Miscanthus floridulus]|uniref:wall-associated receptor kinase 2-like n=1 Tax=Miscanthus floridulus TaxID=154761 RepID=UPI003458A864